MQLARVLVISVFAVAACKESGKQPTPTPTPGSAAGSATGSAAGSAAGSDPQAVQDPAAPAGQAKPKDVSKGDQQDSEWTPAEFKTGMSRWKDVGVYLDGTPIGFLTFGEMPITLKPKWVKDKVSQNKPADCPDCPAWKWAQQRYYRFTDYLKAVGIDIRKVNQIHVYGPKLSQSVVATGKDLQTKLADDFMFRFGTNIGGKPLPWIPEGFGNGKTPDKITGVMVYITRKPPTLTRDGIELDGVPQTGVPYYGEPIRGGVRVYVDDRLAAIIKRQELDAKRATQTPDGELRWSFAEFLKSKGVDTSKIVEGWVIRGELRKEKLAWDELSKMTFSATSQAKGGVSLGDQHLIANTIALHTRHIQDSELPVILPEEEW